MQGVHTSNDHRIVSFTRERGLIGTRSAVQIDVADDTSGEREVIVKMPRRARRAPTR